MKKLDLDIQLFATSGDFGTITWNSAPYTRYHLVWSAIQNVAGNYSDVTATLYYENLNSESEIFYKKINIAGTNYNDSWEWKSSGSGTLSSATKRIYHDANGNGSAYISACDGNLGGWANFNQINRYATITYYNVVNGGLNKISVGWAVNVECDILQYRINGGTWVESGGDTFFITGLTPNTQYSVQIRVRRKDSQLWTESDVKYATTTDINRIISSNFNGNSDSEFIVQCSNPSLQNCEVYIELLNDSKSGRIGEAIHHYNSTNPVFTPEEMLSLAQYIPNNNTANFRINCLTSYEGQIWNDFRDGTYSIVNANPIFTNFEYEDTNETTIGLTDNNQTIIKGYSNLKAIVSTTNKAVALKGATMSKYRLVVGTKQVDANYSSSADVNLQLNNIDNNVFTLYAIDSRGNSTSKQISPSAFIDYFDRYFSAPLPVAIRNDDIGTETTLSFNGLFFNSPFGNTQNDITLAYKYKKTSDSVYTDGVTPLTLTKDGNNFSFSNIIAGDLGANGFDSNHSYNIRLIATDSLGATSYDFILGTGKPNLAISKNGVSINGAYDETIGGDLQIGGKSFLDYTKGIGAIYESTNSTSPATLYGGTWVQLKDRFLIGAGGTYTSGSIGGEATHVHRSPISAGNDGALYFDMGFNKNAGSNTSDWRGVVGLSVTGVGQTYYSNTGSASSIPPYRSVYMWYRSA